MKLEDLKCEFCDGVGEFSRDNADGVAVEGECTFCEGTGIHENYRDFINTVERADNIEANSAEERMSEASHYNWLDDQNKKLESQVKELTKSHESITRLTSNDVCELAFEWLDLNNPDPDKVGDIAERMGMGWDESTEEFLDFDNIALKVSHRRKVYGLNSEIFQLKEQVKELREAGAKVVHAFNEAIRVNGEACLTGAMIKSIQKTEQLLNKQP